MSNVYDVGDTVKVLVTFRDANETLFDPSTVKLLVRKPDDSEVVVYENGDLTHPSTGLFSKEIEIDVEGRWFYRFEGDASLKVAGENNFLARNSKFYGQE